MSNLSPSFNTRFANIGIENEAEVGLLPKKSPKKAYPAHLFPQNYPPPSNTTPSRAPMLSTAKRAISRSSVAPKATNTGALSSKRQLNRFTADKSDPDTLSPCKSKPKKVAEVLQFSFMKQTTSSRKKQTLPVVEKQPLKPINIPTRDATQTRAVSHSELYNKRRTHMAPKKRLISKLALSQCLSAIAAGTAPEPLAASPQRHVSATYTNKAKEDVYARLYKNTTKPRVKLSNSRKSSGLAYPTSVSTPNLAMSLDPTIYPGAKSSDGNKPQTVADVCKVIYNADPLLFGETNRSTHTMTQVDGSTPQKLLHSPEANRLSVFERGELMRKSNIYYLPNSLGTEKDVSINVSSFKDNYGFDDSDGNYIIRPRDHIEYRYEIMRVLGTGSFGNVVLCTDHKYDCSGNGRKVAIKIIKNELDWSLQAVSEIKLLKKLNPEANTSQHIMEYYDHFHFRGHMCIVSEVLSLNLYTFLELTSFSGIGLLLLRRFSRDILRGLSFIHGTKMIHCDIKPENIMIKLPSFYDPNTDELSTDFTVKIIDFGSSCFENETSFSYIQSRFYRAPEVILGAKYGYEIDIWSFGCVIAELFAGTPLLPGKSELEQIGFILEMFGPPSGAHIIRERKRLMREAQIASSKGLSDPIVSDPSMILGKGNMTIDEKKIKKTLLYSLFNLEGKVNLKFLNMQLQSIMTKLSTAAPSPFKRTIKPNSKSIEVALRLHSTNEDRVDVGHFAKFLHSIFKWEREDRASAEELLHHPFLSK